MQANGHPPATVTANIELNLAGQRFQAAVTVPTVPVRRRQMLPLVHSVADAVVNAVVEQGAQKGEHVSCRAGCGACCRMAVPIAPSEARHVRDLVEAMPEPKRTEVKARFAAVRDRLEVEGLREPIERSLEDFSSESFDPLATAYFRLGLACPFLEDESCSVHPQRPVICREHLVISPPENCADPGPAKPVHRLRMPVAFSRALSRFDDATGERLPMVLLSLALDWVERGPAELDAEPAPLLAERLFRHLSGEPLPLPDPAEA